MPQVSLNQGSEGPELFYLYFHVTFEARGTNNAYEAIKITGSLILF